MPSGVSTRMRGAAVGSGLVVHQAGGHDHVALAGQLALEFGCQGNQGTSVLHGNAPDEKR
jgi:hypothetical protein